MSRWTCPRCDREFARAHQAHVCVPGGTVEQTFAGRPAYQREVYDALIAHLRTLGPVHEDAVKVGVFLKHESKIAEVRPMARSLALWLILPRQVDSARVVRSARISVDRFAHMLRFTSPAEVDGDVLGLLTEAYFAAGFISG